jgi:hypothetical protein
VNSLAVSIALEEDFNGDGAISSYLFEKEKIMKLMTIALATALTLTSTFALAQPSTFRTLGRGTVTAPSVGSYQHPVGTTNVLPTWRNTSPAVSRSASAPYGSPFATR